VLEKLVNFTQKHGEAAHCLQNWAFWPLDFEDFFPMIQALQIGARDS
jgi:hypothetical protein